MAKLAYPVVNLNGTSKEALLKQLADPYHKLGEVIDLLAAATPHGRDYQTQEPGTREKALKEHVSRVRRLEEVKGELLELLLAINDQGK